ncbi:chaperone protein DnaJ [Anopheles sinensis]|uniref:Chaperone protein DnaJ n=1 Tax=Anopheles sinensis TaxID=74873 RepID=A0A084WLI4_ANOSI|nr:chaperone protein DnaJ [Anopheles sinensis]
MGFVVGWWLEWYRTAGTDCIRPLGGYIVYGLENGTEPAQRDECNPTNPFAFRSQSKYPVMAWNRSCAKCNGLMLVRPACERPNGRTNARRTSVHGCTRTSVPPYGYGLGM